MASLYPARAIGRANQSGQHRRGENRQSGRLDENYRVTATLEQGTYQEHQ